MKEAVLKLGNYLVAGRYHCDIEKQMNCGTRSIVMN